MGPKTYRNTYQGAVYRNTPAVAIVGDANETVADRDEVHTIHVSDLADEIGSYKRSVALVMDLVDLHMIRRALQIADLAEEGESSPGPCARDHVAAAEKLLSAISEAFDSGLR